MELLKQRILQDGRCFPGGILKVDSFINHQMDPMLLYKVAEEFIYRFRDADINKIVTIEASGIAPAIMVGYIMHLRSFFIKEKQSEDNGEYVVYRCPFVYERPRLHGVYQ